MTSNIAYLSKMEQLRLLDEMSFGDNNTNKVRNPYPYGPRWVSEDVLNCMKDFEEGHSADEEYDLNDVLESVYGRINIEDKLETIILNYDELLSIAYAGKYYYMNSGGADSEGRRAQIMNTEYGYLVNEMEDMKDINGNFVIQGKSSGVLTFAHVINDEFVNSSIEPHAIFNYSSSYGADADIVDILMDNGLFFVNSMRRPLTEAAAETILSEYKQDFDSGVYYEDISVSGGYGVGMSRGVVFVINVDENYVSQLTYTGYGITTPGVSYSLDTGQVYGLDSILEMKDWSVQSDLSVFVNHTVSSSVSFDSYGDVSQRGNGFETAVGASLYAENSKIIVTYIIGD